jgi:hypothetical protein
MSDLLTPDLVRASVQALAALFLAITLLQSGVDKVVDFKGNLGWMTPHFAKSPFAGMVPLLLGVLTVLELASGVFCAAGVGALLLGRGGALASAGLLLGGLNFCALLLGQRLAKDYAGAAGLVPYFLVTLVGLLAHVGV